MAVCLYIYKYQALLGVVSVGIAALKTIMYPRFEDACIRRVLSGQRAARRHYFQVVLGALNA